MACQSEALAKDGGEGGIFTPLNFFKILFNGAGPRTPCGVTGFSRPRTKFKYTILPLDKLEALDSFKMIWSKFRATARNEDHERILNESSK
jgi:hypothetical protein